MSCKTQQLTLLLVVAACRRHRRCWCHLDYCDASFFLLSVLILPACCL